MENQDLSKILIKNSEYYSPNASYVSVLRKYNITTVDQLLDDKIEAIIDENCKTDTKQQLKVFISLLKYKYFEQPLLYIEPLLEREIDLDNCFDYTIKLSSIRDEENDYFSIYNEFGCRKYVAELLLERFIPYAKARQPFLKRPIKLIDFFEWVKDNKTLKSIISHANTIVEAYKKNHLLRNGSIETLLFLKDQLIQLMKMRDHIDDEILKLQDQINALSNNKENNKSK